MRVGIVIPCYNEEEVIKESAKRIIKKLKALIASGKIDQESYVSFIDDGSKDKTWKIIDDLSLSNPLIKGLKLTRNFGHQNALLSGLMHYKDEVDAIISMDADLQDDLSLIERFIDTYKQGYEIVYGVRNNRQTDSPFKRNTAQWFYRIQSLLGVETVSNHADYRLLGKKALKDLSQFKEVDLFLRGIIPMLGYKSTSLYYTRKERFAGKSKYPFAKMVLFAINGITSFSITPLRFIAITGFVIFVISFLMIIWALIVKLILGESVQGWTSTLISLYFLGGIQMISLGVIGEYIGRIFQQSKNRPRYFVEDEVG